MRKAYHSLDDVLRSSWAGLLPRPGHTCSDRVLRSSRLEDGTYAELRQGDAELDTAEAAAAAKLNSFPALARDIFQSFYSLAPRRIPEDELSVTARNFNSRILDQVLQNEDHPTIKSICEGRELPAYEAAGEFIRQTADNLDELLSGLGGDKGALQTLERLENSKQQLEQELSDLLERLRTSSEPNQTLEQAIVAAANKAESKRQQAQAVSKKVESAFIQNREAISRTVAAAVQAAGEKAQELNDLLCAWGNDPANRSSRQIDEQVLSQLRSSSKLLEISKYLGRYREMLNRARRNSYAYGRGEKYAVELGNDLRRLLTSEFALLAAAETRPLFLHRYRQKNLKQYLRRETVYKGQGDIIVCLDESDSTEGEPEIWGKAVALTLLAAAAGRKRRFALIHFSNRNSVQSDLFLPGQYEQTEVLRAAELFLGGGTNFAAPLKEALRLMAEGGFQNADIVFITDGECALEPELLQELRQEQRTRHFTVTGVLVDKEQAALEFSLREFCQNIYHTSELSGDAIMGKLIEQRE